jgi:hypothetical protein
VRQAVRRCHAAHHRRDGPRPPGERDRPETTVTAPYAWDDDTWKAKCFTKERPFLDEAATARWLERKQAYRERKGAGSA